MTEHEFQRKLAELLGEITTLPATERAKLQEAAKEVRKTHQRLSDSVSSLQESVDYLRLSIKYLVFDLEATRRENELLRALLEESQSETDDPNGLV
jgi:nitric oxide reductase activation protein